MFDAKVHQRGLERLLCEEAAAEHCCTLCLSAALHNLIHALLKLELASVIQLHHGNKGTEAGEADVTRNLLHLS